MCFVPFVVLQQTSRPEKVLQIKVSVPKFADFPEAYGSSGATLEKQA